MPRQSGSDVGGARSLIATASACLAPSLWHGSRILAAAFIALIVGAGAVLLTLRFVDPPGSAVMAWQALSGREIRHKWVPLRQISPRLLQAVVVSEDARFCSHYGIDIAALEHAIRDAQARGGLNVRGGSTISMQVVKNLFLWQEKSLGRKGVELMLTPLMELILPKHRILEIYLNIAEWGPGIFGVEAAAQYHFRRSAVRLDAQQSALLAAALPNPIIRRAGRPGTRVQRQARRVFKRAVRPGRLLSCLPKGIIRR